MDCVEKGERRHSSEGVPADRRVAPLVKLTGQALNGSPASPPVAVGDPDHPARLRVGDLENPDQFHSRLKAWLLQQSVQP